MEKERKPSVRVCGLWRGKNENGPALTGMSGGLRYVIWPNKNKKQENSPDFFLTLEEAEREQKEAVIPMPVAPVAPKSPSFL